MGQAKAKAESIIRELVLENDRLRGQVQYFHSAFDYSQNAQSVLRVELSRMAQERNRLIELLAERESLRPNYVSLSAPRQPAQVYSRELLWEEVQEAPTTDESTQGVSPGDQTPVIKRAIRSN